MNDSAAMDSVISRIKALAARIGVKDIAPIALESRAQFRRRVKGTLSTTEATDLYREAQRQLKDARLFEAKLISRSSPALKTIKSLSDNAERVNLLGYEDEFGGRALRYTRPGTVSSMFSPAAYLTELYREARNLHGQDSPCHIDNRRPDLKSLVLSQDNMDVEVPALELCDEVLISKVATVMNQNAGTVLRHLAERRASGQTPYHDLYTRVREGVRLKAPTFPDVDTVPHVLADIQLPRAATEMDISPEDWRLLTEEISRDDNGEMFLRNFGDVSPHQLMSVSVLARWYQCSAEDIRTLIAAQHSYVGLRLPILDLVSLDGDRIQCHGFLSSSANPTTDLGPDDEDIEDLEFAHLYPKGDGLFRLVVRFKNVPGATGTGRQLYARVGSSGAEQLVNSGDTYVWPDITGDGTIRGVPVDAEGQVLPCLLLLRRPTNANKQRYSTVSFARATGTNEGLLRHWLLRFNVFVRLWRATQFAPLALRQALGRLTKEDYHVSGEVLEQLALAKRYMRRYGIELDDAMVLGGAAISAFTEEGEVGQFDRIFNSPPFNGFRLPRSTLHISLDPSSENYSRASSTNQSICAGLGVDAFELYLMARATALNVNINHYSHWYRVSLIARIHGLSVLDLSLLWQAYGYAGNFSGLESQLRQRIETTYRAVQDLRSMDVTPYELWAMTTAQSVTVTTPELRNFLQSLQAIEVGVDNDLPAMLAPEVAVLLELPSLEAAQAVLQWVDRLGPDRLNLQAYWDKVKAGKHDDVSVVAFTCALLQRAWVARKLALPASALLLFVKQPLRLDPQEDERWLGTLAQTVMALHRCARWLNGLGEGATAALTEFIEGNGLTPQGLATAIRRQSNEVASAASYAKLRNQIQDDQRLASWTEIDAVLQWLSLGDLLSMPPIGISELLDLSYGAAAEVDPWGRWQKVADFVRGGLTEEELTALEAIRLPRLTAALCSALMSAVGSRALPTTATTSREALYAYLLLDNLNSGHIRSTRIAEAIASLQLHIHRALTGVEQPEDSAPLSWQFFIDWQPYNSRYATWAGLSKLIYYPENYIDPTVRHGQTMLMTEMLQQLGQAQLNVDTVGDAFQAYLTGFEEVANLRVISGYHDDLDATKGKTYFVGRSDAGEYYWRSADENKRAKTGVLPANAWADWQKIGCAPAPHGELIRPVVFKSRLYVCWLERRDVTPPDDTGHLPEKREYQHELKISHRRYDGSWSIPLSLDVPEKVGEIIVNADSALYCSNYHAEDALIVVVYKKPGATGDVPGVDGLHGFRIRSDMTVDTEHKSEYFHGILQVVPHELDTAELKRVNNILQLVGFSVPTVVPFSLESSGGGQLNGRIDNISITTPEPSTGKLSIGMDVSFDAVLPGPWQILVGYLSADQSSAIRRFSSAPDGVWNALVANDGTILLHGVAAGPPTRIDIDHPGGTSQADYVEYFPEHGGVYKYRSNVAVGAIRFMDVIPSGWLPISKRLLERNDHLAEDGVSIEFEIDNDLVVKRYVDHQSPDSRFEPWWAYVRFARFVIDVDERPARKNIPFQVIAGGMSVSRHIPVTAQINSSTNVITLGTADNGAQYMELLAERLAYRTRLNTLFARKLVSKAEGGVDAILNLQTQQIPEPPLGLGIYLTLQLPRYQPSIHGDEPWVKIYYSYFLKEKDQYLCWEGRVDPYRTTEVTLFVPYPEGGWAPHGSTGKPGPHNDANIDIQYKATDSLAIYHRSVWLSYVPASNTATIMRPSAELPLNPGIADRVFISTQQTEPMDFAGANALYFWELFYYAPMMIAQRMLDEQRFDEAQRWLNYVWSPCGRPLRDDDGQIDDWTKRQWNVRPLLEDVSWNSDPLDSSDPDAVAQHDPMHYKVATFMRALDILIARGDAAYRKLERDTLNEAKMWYSQALNLLGERPFVDADTAWDAPTLGQAASDSALSEYWAMLSRVMRGFGADESGDGANEPSERSANSLLKVFVPEINDMLFGYWDTLALRMYNLRHHLSIDGQPLSLPIYATPADPKALLTAAVAAAGGGTDLPKVEDNHEWRFTTMLDSAKSMVSQLIGLGTTIRLLIERQDAEALAMLLGTQAGELMLDSLKLQDQTLMELEADEQALKESRTAATNRRDHYQRLVKEGVSLYEGLAEGALSFAKLAKVRSMPLVFAIAAAKTLPNKLGFTTGPETWAGTPVALKDISEVVSAIAEVTGDRLKMEAGYERRRQDWDLARKNAEGEVRILDAQLRVLKIRQESARLQKAHLETQQAQTQAQFAFLQTKFTGQGLYSWLRARLATVFYQYYDLTVARCLMAQKAFQRELDDETADFIKPGAWHGNWAGLSCGETLLLNLARMEDAYLKGSARGLEVRRTVSLSTVYEALEAPFMLGDAVAALINGSTQAYGQEKTAVSIEDGCLAIKLSLKDLRLQDDYPHYAGKKRRIKHIGVSLPGMLGTSQDIQAELGYSDHASLSKGIHAMAVSHGVQDDGLFRLDFHDGRLLPFEGVNADSGVLALRFPNPTGKQKGMLENLSDVILHIQYVIR